LVSLVPKEPKVAKVQEDHKELRVLRELLVSLVLKDHLDQKVLGVPQDLLEHKV
jgi:hypothetical protein